MAYDPTKDDTDEGLNPDYNTGTLKSKLRKINLNVDIATQDELNAAYNDLSTKIATETSAYIPADEALSTALKNWALGEELSGALHTEVTAEATARQEADQAIRADLSNNYKVTVVKDATPETSAYIASYTIKQGETFLSPKINIPKDYVVKSAELCTVTTAGEPYPEAQIGDKYIDFVVNTADQGDAKHIYLPVNDLVDVYTGGTTEFATVSVDSNRVITTNVNADLISAAAVTEVVGESTDLSDAMTINGVKKYVDEKVADKNVDAEGDVYVSASAADNKVTVAATAELCAAVANANDAVQDIIVDSDLSALINVQDEGNTQFLHATNKLTSAVNAAETALQSIDKGTDGTYVTTTISEKGDETIQTIGVAVTVATLTAGTNGLAEATDVKQYVDGKITDLSVSAAGDAYVTASSTGKAITVAAADRTKGAIDKVEATSATWDAALQEVKGGSTTYATVSVSDKASNKQTISATVLTHTVADATSIADGIAVASDVKAYIDDSITDLSVSATGDNYISADSTGKAITLKATDKLTAAVNAVEVSAAGWNAKADLTALENEISARKDADEALGTRIDELSGTYADKDTVDNASTTLANAILLSTLNDYQDIDSIINDLITLKAAVSAFAASMKNA